MVFPRLDSQAVGRIERNPNVFKLWQSDNTEVLDNCFRNDFEGWKLSKFVKDTQDQVDIREIIRDNYLFLKEVYLTVSSTSNFPFITTIDFGELIDLCHILDRALTPSGQLPKHACTQGIIDT